MIRKILNTAWILTVLAVFVLTSCDDFYSTSWGKPREYEVSKITLTRSNLDSWKKKATGNPDLAAALVKKIIGELPGKSGAEKAAFQSAGIDLAIEQSGMGVKILEVAGSALSDIDSEDGVKNLLKKVQSGLDSSQAAANNITTIAYASSLPEPGTAGVPEFPDGDPYGLNADPSNVGLAVMVLALAEIPTIDDETDLSDLSSINLDINGSPPQVEVTNAASSRQIALAAYLNLIANDETNRFDGNPITSGIKSAFSLGD
jgi:hypothetical protein